MSDEDNERPIENKTNNFEIKQDTEVKKKEQNTVNHSDT